MRVRLEHIVTLDDVGMVQCAQDLYLALQHLQAGWTVLFQLDYFDSIFDVIFTVNGFIHLAAVAGADLLRDIIHIVTDFLLALLRFRIV